MKTFTEQNRTEPLVSIIVAIYNGEEYIAECIDSIVHQDYENLEIFLVDDGSSDASGKIADKYASEDHRIQVFHQKNLGVSIARNTALDHANGEYVCFVDQDDYLAANYVSYFYHMAVENHSEIAITPAVRKVSSKETVSNMEEGEDCVEIWKGSKAAMEMLYYNVIIAPWNKIISRELIETFNIRFVPNLFGGEGFLFSIECFQHAKSVAVGSKKVYRYRIDNPNSGMTHFSMEVQNNSIRAQKIIESRLIEKTPELLNACKYANWHTHCDCLNTLIGCKVEKKYPEHYREVKKVCRENALCVVHAPVSKKEKLKGLLYFVNPDLSARLINRFRVRKFTIDSERQK